MTDRPETDDPAASPGARRSSWWQPTIATVAVWVIIAGAAVAAVTFARADIDRLKDDTRDNTEAIKGTNTELRHVRESLIRIEVKLGTTPKP